jgi:hypothetical protein
MDASDLLPVVAKRKVKGETGNTLRSGTSDDLERFDNSRIRLMLQSRILSFGIFANDGKVNILMTRRIAWDVLAENKGGIHIQVLSDGDIEGRVIERRDRGVENTL